MVAELDSAGPRKGNWAVDEMGSRTGQDAVRLLASWDVARLLKASAPPSYCRNKGIGLSFVEVWIGLAEPQTISPKSKYAGGCGELSEPTKRKFMLNKDNTPRDEKLMNV